MNLVKRIIQQLIAIIILTNILYANPDTLVIGQEAPKVMLFEYGKNAYFKSKDYIDKKYLIYSFWATWCTPCMKEIPKLHELADSLDQDNSAILVSRINESNVLLKLDEGYLDYLLTVPQTNNIKKSTFTLNGIKTVQYQINHEKLTNIKLFLFINGQTKCLDYFINNQMFDMKLEEIESSLSTLRIN